MAPLLLAAMALPALIKVGTGIYQMNKHVDRTDTTPAAFSEQLAGLRQQAANATMPGLGGAENQLAQTQAATLDQNRRAAGSGADLLAAASAADAQRNRGENALFGQADAYHTRAMQQLNQGLGQQAQYQQHDTMAYNQAKAALKGAGISNLFGGISDLAGVAAAGASGANGNPAGLSGAGLNAAYPLNQRTIGNYQDLTPNPTTFATGYPS